MVDSSIGYVLAAQNTMTVKPIFNRLLTLKLLLRFRLVRKFVH